MPRMFADHYRASFPITDASKGKKLHAEQLMALSGKTENDCVLGFKMRFVPNFLKSKI